MWASAALLVLASAAAAQQPQAAVSVCSSQRNTFELKQCLFGQANAYDRLMPPNGFGSAISASIVVQPINLIDVREDEQILQLILGVHLLSNYERWRATLSVLWKIALFLLLLYVFICSLSFLSDGFRLLGGRAASRVFSQSAILQSPVVGLMIGVLTTVLVQSSSTSTSITVSMVAADILPVRNAIYIVMGANIGTSVTNTIVSLAQSVDRAQFRRAFAAATVHDMFNWLSVIVLLPLEALTHYLQRISAYLVDAMDLTTPTKGTKRDFLKALTKPVTTRVLQLDKKLITKLAEAGVREGNSSDALSSQSLVKSGDFLLADTGLSDTVLGLCVLTGSLLLLSLSLVAMVKTLNALLGGRIAIAVKRIVHSDLPRPFGFLTGYFYIVFGSLATILVQSSSVFTSTLTPLCGLGVISLERMYPLTLGSNIGTTFTSVLAALASSTDRLGVTMQVALCHFMFNISGILLYYPLPATRFPIGLAKRLGNVTARYRWFAALYLLVMFVVTPLTVLILSLAGRVVLIVIGGPLMALGAFVVIVNVLQELRPKWLPERLRGGWTFLPEWMRSLEYYDRVVFRRLACCMEREATVGEKVVHYGEAAGEKVQAAATVTFELSNASLR